MKTHIYIPSDLDLIELAAKYPPPATTRFDHVRLLLSIIIERSARDRRHVKKHDGYIPLHSKVLEEQGVRNLNEMRNWMIKAGLIEVDLRYIVGEKAMWYRLAPAWREKVIERFSIPKSKVKGLTAQRARLNFDPSAHPQLARWFNDDLNIRDEALDRMHDELMALDPLDRIKALGRYNAGYVMHGYLQEGWYFFHRDETIARLHHNLTTMRADLRDYVRYGDEILTNVDIKNSQPFFSTVLLDPRFWDQNELGSNLPPLHYSNILHPPPLSLSPPISIMFAEINKLIGNQDVTEYIKLVVEGELYEHFEREMQKERPRSIPYTRKEIKEIIFIAFFSSNRFIGQPEAWKKRLFKRLFPSVYGIFACIKRFYEDNTLARILQRIESYVVIDSLAVNLAKDYPVLPMYTIHDSIACPNPPESFTPAILDEIERMTGYKPTIATEVWNSERPKAA